MIRNGDWIQTYTGLQFWPMDPREEEVSALDIAHALSNQCRFAGHCLHFYSVAEHCCHLFDHTSKENRKWALLHDAAEAYVVDIPRPMKRFMPQYCLIEDNVQRVICMKFGLSLKMPAEVKTLDTRILTDEMEQVMAYPPEEWSGLLPALEVNLALWSPPRAQEEFLSRLEAA